ncbi:putative hydroxymethylpyrimidine transporter CytX [Lentilactobacillus sp. Marseille-Q4993]|uniref:putative hydroxymethylpyrimidine transporter CytX n=1 Tax=Lentilactobacillus sp. Marseille-Q4993 TaxID=3039492 RepID=UPI0024BD3D27|nr:putative hydroxymethylpyrimidine transporter CytX [Lentilactobacillus sp. Marseille-Q4993]
MQKSKLSGLFLLWLGAAISIAEIVTGTLVAPLGVGKGITAIILGHVIGCFLFLFPAGYLSAKQNQTAIAVTESVFGKWGVTLFSGLNAIQLLGWTAVMIVNAQLAMNAISKKVFNYQSVIVMSVIVAALIVVWLIFDHEWLFKINNIVVILLAIGMLIVVWAIINHGASHTSVNLGKMTFGSAVELNVTMALSWLPLIGDYTKQNGNSVKISFVSVVGYFLGSTAMFLIGFFTVIVSGQTDFNAVLAATNVGMIALLVIVFSTVTTTFMDAYSAATNIDNIIKKGHVNLIGIGVTIVGLVIALFVSMAYYQNFLYAIGAAFTPLFSILFVSILILHKKLPVWLNFCWWVIGFFGYTWLQRFDFVLGTTILLGVILAVAVWLSGLVVGTKKLAS